MTSTTSGFSLLKHPLHSPLARRIAATVFLAIVFIEAVILVPSVLRLDDDLHQRTREDGLALFRMVEAASDSGKHALMQVAVGSMDVAGVTGAALLFDDGTPPFVTGARPSIDKHLPAAMPFSEILLSDVQAHDLAWRGDGDGYAFTLALRFDTSSLASEIMEFVIRVGGLTLLICIFTTAVIMFVLAQRVLSPMIGLRESLINSRGDLRELALDADGLSRGDEVGDLYRGVQQLAEEITDNLQEIEALARLPAENPNPVMRCRSDGRILLANAASEAIPRLFRDSEKTAVSGHLLVLITEAFDNRKSRTEQIELDNKTYLLAAQPFPNAGYVNIYGRDITEQKAAEAELRVSNTNLEREVERRTERLQRNEAELTRNIKELERSQQALELRTTELSDLADKYALERERALASEKAKSEFLATMSHEIRTPMTGILGLADILLESNLGPPHHDTVVKLRSAGESLITIINDILDLSKIQAGKLEIEHIDFNLSELIADAIDLIRPKVEDKGLIVSLEIDEDMPMSVNSDPTRIRQILINLVGNAVKFTHEGSVKIAVTCDNENDGQIKLQFYVIDSGIGIPSDMRDRLFDDFTQADTSTSRNYEGTGLGLAISRRLCALMDGEIGVESEVGSGSTFWFTLTVEAARTEIAASRTSSGLSFTADRSLRILVAEDNPLNQLIMKSILTPLGHHLTLVETGAAALAAVRGDNFDLVLMDVRMPEMNGPDATRAIRQLERPKCDIPVIAVTADALAEHVAEYLAAGMNACVNKPIDRSQLVGAINEAFGEDIHVPREVRPQSPIVSDAISRDEVAEIDTAPSGQVLDFLAELDDLAGNSN